VWSCRMESYQTDSFVVINALQSDGERGLFQQEVINRQKKDGYNQLPDVRPRSLLSIFISQFENPLIYILFFAALIIFVFGSDKLDAFIISGVLLFNAVLGTIQEMRTKNIIESLKRFIKTESVVMRDGGKTIVEDTCLVVGDIIFLQEGQRVPADARIIDSNNIQVDESVLTGESQPVKKNSNTVHEAVVMGDRKNMLFKGTYVLAGTAKAVVVAIGRATEIGKIHGATESIQTDMPLRKELDNLSYWILIFITVVCLFLFGIGLFMGKPIAELLVMLTALFICVVPEGLPVVFMLVLVTGALRMAKHSVLVKNMQAVEALGRTDIIVIDKTGTLTRNEMIVSRVWTTEGLWQVTGQGYHGEGSVYREGNVVKNFSDDSALRTIAVATSLLNNAEVIYLPQLDVFDIKGDPTEAALSIFSKKIVANIALLVSGYTKVYEIPFDSSVRYHAGFYQKNNQCVAFIIGSPETVIHRCVSVDSDSKKMLERFLDEGLRVVAVGTKIVADFPDQATMTREQQEDFYKNVVKHDLQFLGFCGIEDSIRPEVASVIKDARKAGLSVVMATGDHQRTAVHVAESVGIFRQGDECIDGSEIDALNDEQMRNKMNGVTVFSRVSPGHKMRIVTLMQQSGKVVAMTGDGINDAPSLMQADLGIAMGSIGTEVAKQASDLVLLNDSFANIIEAIEEGRHIFYTLKRVVLYFFSTNMGEVLIVLFAFMTSLLTGVDLPLPITAVQILWLNLVTDGFLDVGLSMEPKESGLLQRYWLEKKQRLIDGELMGKMLLMSIPMGIGSLLVFLAYYQQDLAYARTMTLITMAMFQWFNAWNCRSTTRSLFGGGLFANKWLLLATVFVLFLQCCLLYVPFMQYVFKTVPLSLNDWMVVIGVSSSIVVVEEVRKSIVRYWN
jgi:magnesium-transporting ATPase (P-type)